MRSASDKNVVIGADQISRPRPDRCIDLNPRGGAQRGPEAGGRINEPILDDSASTTTGAPCPDRKAQRTAQIRRLSGWAVRPASRPAASRDGWPALQGPAPARPAHSDAPAIRFGRARISIQRDQPVRQRIVVQIAVHQPAIGAVSTFDDVGPPADLLQHPRK